MKQYKVKITETLVREVTVTADSLDMAQAIAYENYMNSADGYVLDESDFTEVDFLAEEAA